MPPLKAERGNNTPFELATVNVLAVQGLASSGEGGASCGCCFYFVTILPSIINPDTGLGRLWFRPVVWLLAKIDLRFFFPSSPEEHWQLCLNLWLSVFLKLRIADTFFEPPECCVWINCWGLGRSTSLHKPYTARGKGWELIVVDGWTVNSQCIKPFFLYCSCVNCRWAKT